MIDVGFPAPVAACEEGATPGVRDFFEKHINFEKPDLHAYSLEEQYDIVVFGNTCIHPPNMELTVEFARHGADVLELLKTKLNETDDVSMIVSIFRVLIS